MCGCYTYFTLDQGNGDLTVNPYLTLFQDYIDTHPPYSCEDSEVGNEDEEEDDDELNPSAAALAFFIAKDNEQYQDRRNSNATN